MLKTSTSLEKKFRFLENLVTLSLIVSELILCILSADLMVMTVLTAGKGMQAGGQLKNGNALTVTL
jgi:thermostable 8-oxoguanine DNA glycosylase